MNISLESIFKDARQLQAEIHGEIELRDKIVGLLVIAVACSGLYGLVMGFHHSLTQALSSAVKVPLLFMATLAICLPTLHFVGLLFGSRVRFLQSLAVLLWGIAAMSVLLGAFAPVALFFSMGQPRYEFILLLHVSIFAFCGMASLLIIRRNMKALTAGILPQQAPMVSLYSLSKSTKEAENDETKQEEEKSPTPQIDLRQKPEETQSPPFFLGIWMCLYMFVGTQMAYILSPFIGKQEAFVLVHKGSGNFFQAVLQAMDKLLR